MVDRTSDSTWPPERPSGIILRHAEITDHVDAAPTSSQQARSGDALLSGVSGQDCARALERCGILRFEEAPGVIWMEVGATFVAVPRCDAVPVETLCGILTDSGLSVEAFVEHLR